jgi:hypothetical protein
MDSAHFGQYLFMLNNQQYNRNTPLPWSSFVKSLLHCSQKKIPLGPHWTEYLPVWDRHVLSSNLSSKIEYWLANRIRNCGIVGANLLLALECIHIQYMLVLNMISLAFCTELMLMNMDSLFSILCTKV